MRSGADSFSLIGTLPCGCEVVLAGAKHTCAKPADRKSHEIRYEWSLVHEESQRAKLEKTGSSPPAIPAPSNLCRPAQRSKPSFHERQKTHQANACRYETRLHDKSAKTAFMLQFGDQICRSEVDKATRRNRQQSGGDRVPGNRAGRQCYGSAHDCCAG